MAGGHAVNGEIPVPLPFTFNYNFKLQAWDCKNLGLTITQLSFIFSVWIPQERGGLRVHVCRCPPRTWAQFNRK